MSSSARIAVVPLERGEIHEHRAGRIRDVGDVHAVVGAAGQVPGQPGVDGAEQELAAVRGSSPFRAALVEDPLELEGARIGREREAGGRPVAVDAPALGILGRQSRDRVGGPCVLPHDRRPYRSPGPCLPDDGGFPLIADPDRRQRPRPHPGLAQRDADAGTDALDDLVGVVLDPAGARRDLPMLELVARDHATAAIEEDAATRGRALVDRGDEAAIRVSAHAGVPTSVAGVMPRSCDGRGGRPGRRTICGVVRRLGTRSGRWPSGCSRRQGRATGTRCRTRSRRPTPRGRTCRT